MEFARTVLKDGLALYKLISLHYFEVARDYVFEGEKHDFWEFLYVDKGEVEVMADTMGYALKQGDIIFHKPGEFHSIWANRKIAPNLVVIAFECNSRAMKFFENRILKLDDHERNLLANIVKEGMNAYLPPLDNPRVNILKRRKQAPFGCEQLIRSCMSMLLISLIRKGGIPKNESRLSTSAKERTEEDIVRKITRFMQENIGRNTNTINNENIDRNVILNKNATLKLICDFSHLGRTYLTAIFKDKTGMGVMEYYKMLKVEKAKSMVREEKYNFTEIADLLGYNSIHSFSRHFKNVTGMSPSEYSRSVKARI